MGGNYYKLRQLSLLQSAMDSCYKLRQLFYYKVRHGLLQIATGITKCDDYYKLRQYIRTRNHIGHPLTCLKMTNTSPTSAVSEGPGRFSPFSPALWRFSPKSPISPKSPVSKGPRLSSNSNCQRQAIFRHFCHFGHCMHFWI